MDLIHKLILRDDTHAIKNLLQQNNDIANKLDDNGNTPLMYACIRANIDIVSLLLENGANASLKNNKGWNSYMVTEFYHLRNKNEKYIDVLNLLTDYVN